MPQLVSAALIACAIAAPVSFQPRPQPKSRVLIVFDPTIQASAIEPLLEQFSTGLIASERIDEHTDAVFWIAHEVMTADPGPKSQKTFEFSKHSNGAQTHALAVRTWIQEVEAMMESAWTAAHRPEKATVEASCLLSTLSSVSDFLATATSVEATDLFLVSDMLEVCTDWGRINMEAAASAIDNPRLIRSLASDSARRVISLKPIDNIYVLLQPSSFVRTPIQRAAVKDVWSSVLKSLGARNEILFWLGVPSSFPLRR